VLLFLAVLLFSFNAPPDVEFSASNAIGKETLNLGMTHSGSYLAPSWAPSFKPSSPVYDIEPALKCCHSDARDTADCMNQKDQVAAICDLKCALEEPNLEVCMLEILTEA